MVIVKGRRNEEMPVAKKKAVKEIVIYSDGSVGEKGDDYSAPKMPKMPDMPDWLMPMLGLVGMGVFGVMFFYMYTKDKSPKDLVGEFKTDISRTTGSSFNMNYSSPVPQPMVTVDEFAYPVSTSGRAVGQF